MKISIRQLKRLVREEFNRASQLDEKVAIDDLANKIKQTVNTCSQYVEDSLNFVKSKRPGWQAVAVALKDAHTALEEAHEALLAQMKSGNK